MTYYYIAVHVDTLLLSDTDVTDMLSQLLMEPQPHRYHEYMIFLMVYISDVHSYVTPMYAGVVTCN